jgi:hypothetical protein
MATAKKKVAKSKKTKLTAKQLERLIDRIEGVATEQIEGIILVVTNNPKDPTEQHVTLKTNNVSPRELQMVMLNVIMQSK